MRTIVVVILLSLLARASEAVDIQGKWGLGVSTGLVSSTAEASLMRGKTDHSAWILDLQVSDDATSLSGQPLYPGGPLGTNEKDRRLFISAGPRYRRYTRPQATISPYWDLFLHGLNDASHRESSDLAVDQIRWGGQLGLDMGAEYFTPWSFTVAAHTNVISATVQHVISRQNSSFFSGRENQAGTRGAVSLGFSPRLQVRVYF